MFLALTITGILTLFLYVALVVLAVVGIRWLLGLMGVSIPQPVMAIVGAIVLILVLLWFFGGMR